MGRVHSDLLERSCQRWEAEQTAADRISQRSPRDFSIALSREYGTPGTSIAREVGTMLKWPVYDHELLQRCKRQICR
jgi:hypothetical protein